MNNFGGWLTPEEAFAQQTDTPPPFTLAQLRDMAVNNARCMNCGAHVWRIVDTELCFSCTTGEADASDDYEIGEPY